MFDAEIAAALLNRWASQAPMFGEVGLAGEIRPSPRGQERLKEAAKLGFSVAVIPKANAPKQPIEGLQVVAVERIEQAIDRVRTLE